MSIGGQEYLQFVRGRKTNAGVRARWRPRRQPLSGAPGLEKTFGRLTLLGAFCAVAIMLGAWFGDVFENAELAMVDPRFELRGETDPEAALLIVAIDDVTLQELDLRWPFPRSIHAELIDRIDRDGPAAIVYDVQFTEPSDPFEDSALIDAVARADAVVLATTEVADDGSTNVFGGLPLEELGARAGSALFSPDPGGVIRRVPYEVERLPTLAVAAAETATGQMVDGTREESEWIDFHGGPGSIPTISFSRAIDQQDGFYSDLIVVIGASAPTLKDIHTTSTTSGEFMAGPELEAHAISTVVRGFPLQSSPAAVDIALLVLLGFMPALLARRLALSWTLGLVIVAAFAYLVAVQLAFNWGLVLPVLYPLLTLALAAITVVVVAAAVYAVARERARDLFARFVPRDVVDEVLARTDDDLRLGGSALDGTAMFVDLRSFTAFVEAHDVDDVLAVLNRYLEMVSDAVHRQGGTVVSYQGDGVMAVFGAPLAQPDHAGRALECARKLVNEGLPALNEWVRARGLDQTFSIGVGLASGRLRSGNVGSSDRVEYTAIGDATNTAARLQGLTRESGLAVLIAASVVERLEEPANGLVDAGVHAVAGKSDPVHAFTFATSEAAGDSATPSTLAE